MRNRAILAFFSICALASLLFALSCYRTLQRERRQAACLEADLTSQRARVRAELEEALKRDVQLTEQVSALTRRVEGWKAQRETDVAQASKQREKLAKTLDEIRELAAKPQAGESLSAALAPLSETQGQLAETLTRLEGSLEKAQAAFNTELAKLSSEIQAELEKRVAVLLASQVEDRGSRVEDRADLQRLDLAVRALSDKLDRLLEKVAAAKVAALRSPSRPPPARLVSTTVVAVEEDAGVVVLGAGREEGLEEGHELFVSRDGRRVGRVRVIKLYEDIAGAEVLEVAPGEVVREGDRASTSDALPASSGRVRETEPEENDEGSERSGAPRDGTEPPGDRGIGPPPPRPGDG